MGRRGETGLTLVEIIFSVAVLAIGLTAVVAVVTEGAVFNQVARSQQLGAQAAQTRMEDVLAQGADDYYSNLYGLSYYTNYVQNIPTAPQGNWDGTAPDDQGSGGYALESIIHAIQEPCYLLEYGGYETGMDQYHHPEEFQQGGIMYGLSDAAGASSRCIAVPISLSPDIFVVMTEVDFPYHYIGRGKSSQTGGPQAIMKTVRTMSLQFTGYGGSSPISPSVVGTGKNVVSGVIKPLDGWSVYGYQL